MDYYQLDNILHLLDFNLSLMSFNNSLVQLDFVLNDLGMVVHVVRSNLLDNTVRVLVVPKKGGAPTMFNFTMNEDVVQQQDIVLRLLIIKLVNTNKFCLFSVITHFTMLSTLMQVKM